MRLRRKPDQAPPFAAYAMASLTLLLSVVAAASQWTGPTPFDGPAFSAPNSAFALVDAINHAQKGQFSAALAELDQVIAADSMNSDLYDARASILLRMGELARAKADIDRALALDPNNLDAQAHAANLLDLQGEHARALAEFDRILKINSQSISAHIGKGGALLSLGQFDRALAEFDRALAVTPNPMLVDALVARGVALAGKGRLKEANANIERALDSSSDNAKAILGQALVLLITKHPDRAVTVLDRSIAGGNEDFAVFLLRGKALAQTGAFDRAIADLDQVLKLRPKDVEALNARASSWVKKKDYGRALADLDQSIAAQPTVAGYVVRGSVYELQGKCSLAMADYRQARELKAANPLEAQAQTAAKGRLDQYARSKACGPVGERRLASGGAPAAL